MWTCDCSHSHNGITIGTALQPQRTTIGHNIKHQASETNIQPHTKKKKKRKRIILQWPPSASRQHSNACTQQRSQPCPQPQPKFNTMLKTILQVQPSSTTIINNEGSISNLLSRNETTMIFRNCITNYLTKPRSKNFGNNLIDTRDQDNGAKILYF